MNADLDSCLSAATKAAQEASVIILEAFKGSERHATKKDDETLVTETDTASERHIVEILRRATPEFGIYAEEETAGKPERKEYTWIIDPLDGTHNFYYGVPHFAVSIALEHRGEILVAVTSLLTEQILLSAVKSGGCFANGERVHVSDRSLERGLLLIDTYWDETDRKIMDAFAADVDGLGILNSACTSIAYVALGRADAFIDRVDKPWDIAAGSLLVQEAGGTVTDLKGEAFDVYDPKCIASNGMNHDAILSKLNTFPL